MDLVGFGRIRSDSVGFTHDFVLILVLVLKIKQDSEDEEDKEEHPFPSQNP